MRVNPNQSEHGVAPMKYLRYDQSGGGAGMAHCLSNLECLLREAATLQRVTVLPPLRLAPHHNFGIVNDWRWETYFNLEEARMIDPDSGMERRLPLVSRLPGRLATAVTLDPGRRVPASAAACELIVRRVGRLYRRDVPQEPLVAARLRMPPSTRVLELARPVIERLAALPAGYAAVHVRRGDRLRRGGWTEGTSPEAVCAKLREHGFGAGATVFFLSDERDPEYWGALSRCCRPVRHTGFAQLSSIVSGSEGRPPDNYLLYEVEKEIMRHAGLRIETVAGKGDVAAHDALLDASFLRRPVQSGESPTPVLSRGVPRWFRRKRKMWNARRRRKRNR